MSIGIVELIAMLMGASGFSVGTNPTTPTPQAALEYAMPDADVIAYADIGAVVPGNYKVLTGLVNQPQIKASPELSDALRQLVKEIEGPRGLAKGLTGIDLVTDISDVTASMKLVPQHDPDWVVTVHGKLDATTIDKVAKISGKSSTRLGNNVWFDAGDGTAVGFNNGAIVAGTTKLVQARLADTWKAPALTAGTNLGAASDVIANKPVLAIVVGLSPSARKQALAMHGGNGNASPNFLLDVIKRHKQWSFAINRDGIGWTWIDTTRAGMESMAQLSDGIVDLLRAAQIAPRGFAKIALGSLDSYKGTSKQLDDVIRHKADLMKIVDTYTGDGQFKAQLDKDTRTNKLTVRLSGKSLSDVIPLGGLVPVFAAWGVLERSSAPAPVLVQPQKNSRTLPPPPAKKQGNAPHHP
jgi:hypothetical protein